MKVTTSEFTTSAVRVGDVPRDGIPQVALVGRSNVGKSSLINALVRRKIARTSAAPGKTRLANFYRVELSGVHPGPRTGERRAGPRFTGTLYLVDLPGYGYARGGQASARAFDALTQDYFGWLTDTSRDQPPARRILGGTILVVDGRHPGLPRDLAAHAWIADLGLPFGVVATKVDTLGRTARQRAHRESETVLNARVLPVSTATGEGLRELWKLIIRLVTGGTSTAT